MNESSAPGFADTNVWLYSFIVGEAPAKTPLAQGIVSDRSIVVSTQVINEVCINLLRKAAFTEQQIRELVAAYFERHQVILVGRETLHRASLLRERYQFAYWDSLMLATALQAGANRFYSEDMHSGMIVEGSLQIVNPFSVPAKFS